MKKIPKVIKLDSGMTVERFYDRSVRSWMVQVRAGGQLIGSADWCYTEREAMKIQEQLAEANS